MQFTNKSKKTAKCSCVVVPFAISIIFCAIYFLFRKVLAVSTTLCVSSMFSSSTFKVSNPMCLPSIYFELVFELAMDLVSLVHI